jgi:hypothetical protein
MKVEDMGFINKDGRYEKMKKAFTMMFFLH